MKKKVLDFDTQEQLIDRGAGQMRLVRTDAMDSIEEFCPNFLRPMYHSKDKTKTIYASILKAAFLQRRVCFLFSRRELQNLVKNDVDNRYKSVNEKDYTSFILHIIGNDILKYVFEPNDFSGMAALVLFNHEIQKGLMQLEPTEFYETQLSKAKEIYNKKLKKLTEAAERKHRRKTKQSQN